MSLAPPIWRHPDFSRGARDMAGVSLGIGAWGLVTGMAMVKSGIGLGFSLLMTVIVFAGSAQLASLPLLVSGAPLWVIWMTALCVNLRFVIFSAGWRAYFGHLPVWRRLRRSYFSADLNYVCFMQRFPQPATDAEHRAYFWGGVVINWTAWQVLSLLGTILTGTAVLLALRLGLGW